MKLSEKIYNKKDFSTVKGMFGSSTGYDADQVEVFLDEVVVGVEALEKEILNLRNQIKNLLEERKIEEQVDNNIEGQQELTDMKEKLRRSIEQCETLERASKKLFYKAEEVAHEMKTEAEQSASTIVEEAKQQANTLLKKVEERTAEKEREIQRLENKEKELREQFAGFADLIRKAVNK